MKILKILLITLMLGGLTVLSVSCSSEPDSAALSENQVVTVQRGNLTIDITASGNLVLSSTEDLTFDLFYQEGTVEEVLVEEGDTVKEGQVLASLDKEEWDEQLSALDDKVTAAERQLTAKERDLLQTQINLQTSEQNLKNARGNKAAQELALLNKQISLDQAKYNLSVAEETHTWPDLEIAEAEVEKAKAFLEYALDGGWDLTLTRAQAELEAAEKVYNALIEGFDTEEVAIKKKQVESAEMALVQAQQDLDDVAEDITSKELQVKLAQARLEDARIAVEDAQADLEDAQADLNEAEGKSPAITAPFAGFITKVNVEGGDEILRGTVALQLADPNKFEADILVSEMDILQVKLGGDAWVQVDAMQGLSLPSEVTHISPTATIQSGVVNYKVKVEIQSLQSAMQERQEARQEAMQGELPERLKQAIEEGRITQEQAEEMIKQGYQGPREQQGLPTMLPENFQLREGLTVIVSILVDERNDVLLVPNRAITRQGMKTYVKMSKDGIIEDREIKIGISDWQFTEVTGGLSEGEEIVVPQGTTTTSTTSQQRPPRMPILGIGRPH